MKKNYTTPEFDVVVSLSEYCVGLNLNKTNDRSGYTQVDGEDIFGDE